MATSGLSGRLGRLEERLGEAVIKWQAQQAARKGRARVADYEQELRRFYRLVTVRLGPRPDRRALAALVAEEYGADAAATYRELRRLRAARQRRRGTGR